MGELFFVIIVGTIVIGPIWFLIWAISSISSFGKKLREQAETIETLQERLARLQSGLWRLEKSGGAVASGSPTVQAQSVQPAPPGLEKSGKPASVNADIAPLPTGAFATDQSDVFQAGPARTRPAPAVENVAHSETDNATTADPHQVNAFFEQIEHGSHEAIRSGNADLSSHRHKEPLVHPQKPAIAKTDWSSMDFESMIGGNLMNKAGAFLLVIGMALFLNYSFAALGPWAKLAAGATFSTILLAWGIFLERKKSGNLMAVGLIGAGWSCLYLTAFSAHGVAATKVIETPLVGMLLLIAVSCGMIAHSLRYRSEVATGLAFIFAFAGLFVAEVSLFSEVAAVIMAISMLAISWYFDWHQLASAGLILTYGSMLARLNWNSPPSTLGPLQRIMFLQPLLLVLWSTFELVGMSFMRRNPTSEEPTRFLFPMNFVAYLVASLLTWPMVKEAPLYFLAGLIMAQYIVTGLARGFWCSNPGEAAVEKVRFFLGSCEDSLVIAAGALCYGIWYLLPAPVVVIGWAVVGLILVEIAYRLPWQLMRFIGHLIVTVAFFRVFIANLDIAGASAGISHRLLTVVPVIFMMLHLYYRTDTELSWEASPTGGTRQFAPAYSYYALILAAALVRFELGAGLTPPIWAVLAIVMTGLGQKLKNVHFGRQGLYLAIGAIGYGLGNDWHSDSINPVLGNPWGIGLVSITCLYACRWMTGNEVAAPADSILSGLDAFRQHIFSLGGSIGLAYLLYVQISGGFLTLAWSLMGMGLLVAGFMFKDRLLRFSGLGLVLLCIIKVFLYDARVLEAPLRILAFMCLGGAMIAISWGYTRYKDRIEELLK
ncbi:MAG: DUF2339 domain-containing protein [Candidatus Riflebacteria bacterium]|nr:DUF2339 domain-containing protein [Candidatus Riflebacteria bacterium]